MRVLLSTIGSRGDVQPLVALAVQLRDLGQDVHFCVPPDFREWIEGLGFSVTPIGPELRKMTAAAPPPPAPGAQPASSAPSPFSPERRRQLAEATVVTQFETVSKAAERCDVIVAATALQIAARSVAEARGIPYHFVAYCPNVIPSLHHAPPPLPPLPGQPPMPPDADNREHWARESARFTDLFGSVLNAHRERLSTGLKAPRASVEGRLGLAPVDDVQRHVLSDRPWLAADATLAPWPDAPDLVFQTGAWILRDDRPLSRELNVFLDAGEPPIYFGFGSIRAPQDLSRVMIQSARALGRRAIVSRGWADLALVDAAEDCLAIGEVNQQALFPRVAAIVHHGGAGTTTAAALGGAPQVIIPQMYDQHYWAQQVQRLGIGVAHAPGAPTTESLTAALAQALRSETDARAKVVARSVLLDGASAAARHIVLDGV